MVGTIGGNDVRKCRARVDPSPAPLCVGVCHVMYVLPRKIIRRSMMARSVVTFAFWWPLGGFGSSLLFLLQHLYPRDTLDTGSSSQSMCVVAALPKEKSSSQSPEPEGTGTSISLCVSMHLCLCRCGMTGAAAEEESRHVGTRNGEGTQEQTQDGHAGSSAHERT